MPDPTWTLVGGVLVLAIILGVGRLTPGFTWRLVLAAARSLDTHFLRSLLATLGVLIGVGSVVACMSILEGMTNEILRNLSTLGSNVLYVSACHWPNLEA